MAKFLRKCKAIGEVAVMEVSQVGVRTRARTLAMAEANAKRRKVVSEELQFIQLRSHRRLMNTPKNLISPANSDNSDRVIPSISCSRPNFDQVLDSQCSSNGSSELVNESLRSVIDLEVESHEFENSTYGRERREKTPSSELRFESNNLDSTGKPSKANSRHKSTAVNMPTDSEIEDFFSTAEKDEKKRFAEKYNYDIVKDSPLEGRFEWIQLKKQ